MALNYSSINDDGAFSFRNLERFEIFIIILPYIIIINFMFNINTFREHENVKYRTITIYYLSCLYVSDLV